MPDMELLIVITGVVVVVLFALRRFTRLVGWDCHECGTKVQSFGEIAPDRQEEILRYFRIHEKRDPDTSAIFVCGRCLMVYDDFSGEKKSWSGDDRSLCKICNSLSVWYLGNAVITGEVAEFRETNSEWVKEIECLRCERKPIPGDCVLCDTAIKPTGCRNCQTLYIWRQFEPSKYKFLVPLTDKAILQSSTDLTMGGL